MAGLLGRVVKGKKKRTKTGPLAELLAVLHLDQRDLVLRAEGSDELLVGILLAVLVENAHVGLAAVESLGGLTETAGETVVHQRQLQDALEGILNGHLTLGGIGGHFDLLDDFGYVVFYVRLLSLSVVLCFPESFCISTVIFAEVFPDRIDCRDDVV